MHVEEGLGDEVAEFVAPADGLEAVHIGSVLVVDDAALNRKYACRMLQGVAEVVQEAEDGLEAVQKVRQSVVSGKPYDVILMDFVMPIMDGPTATREIRQLGYRGLVLAVTGNVTDKDVTLFKEHGANHVLPKPLTKTALLEQLVLLQSK